MSDLPDYAWALLLPSVIAAALCVLCALRGIARGARRLCWRIRFRMIFGVWPSTDSTIRRINQAVVDEITQGLINSCQWLDEDLIRMRQRYDSEDGASFDARADIRVARDTRRKLSRTERQLASACVAGSMFA